MKIFAKATAAALALLLAGASTGSATTVGANLNIDNGFDVYLTTDLGSTGPSLGSGENWRQTFSYDLALAPGVTNYLLIEAYDTGGPQAMLASFSLSDALFRFGNGGQTLLTGDEGIKVSTSGFTGPFGDPIIFGTNGQADLPWTEFNNPGDTAIAGQPLAAEWIWAAGADESDGFNGGTPREFTYFAIEITPIPGPFGAVLLVSALGLAAAVRRRR
ncbi:MAG: hypothetical protein AAF763_11270 [Pseudomonadota bacterium]